MKIRTVKRRGLKRFIEDNDPRELRGNLVKRVGNILAFLISSPNMEAMRGPPGWRIHQLVGDRAGTWSIAVSGNWRITFLVDRGEITDLDLEDYH
jgi:proteic killer suppression protein